MIERTNFLWLGELIAEIAWAVIGVLGLLIFLPYMAAYGFPDFNDFPFIYPMFGAVALINIGSSLWKWQRKTKWAQTLSATPEQALVHWRYDEWTWQEYAQQQSRYLLRSMAKWAPVSILIGGFVLYMWQQAFSQQIIYPLLIWMGINLALTLILMVVVPYYRIRNTAAEAIISNEGMLIGGTVHFWKSGDVTLKRVQMVEQPQHTLEFTVRIPNNRNRSTETIRVPVPAGQEQEAQRVVAALSPIGMK